MEIDNEDATILIETRRENEMRSLVQRSDRRNKAARRMIALAMLAASLLALAPADQAAAAGKGGGQKASAPRTAVANQAQIDRVGDTRGSSTGKVKPFHRCTSKHCHHH